MRLFSTADWKATADSGKQEVCAPFMSLSRGNTCILLGWEYQRTGNPHGEYFFHTVDLQTLKLKRFDPTGMGRLNRDGPFLLACTDHKPLFASITDGRTKPDDPRISDLAAPFVFDLKTGKKTIEL